MTARWLEIRAEIDYEIEHRSYESLGHADRMSRFMATAATLNMTKTMNVDPSAEGQLNLSSPNFLSSNSLFTPEPQLKCNTLSQDTDKLNKTDYEHSEVGKIYEIKKTNYTDDE